MNKSLYVLLSVAAAALPPGAMAQGVSVESAQGQSQGPSPAQREQDENACHRQATQQAGIDPTANSSAPEKRSGGALRGALVGGAIGGVGGSLGGDFGKGAAIGAVGGGVLGGVRQSNQNNKAQDKYNAQVATYNNVMAACMRSRGYTVN